MAVGMKQCTKCRMTKPFSEFSPHKLGRGGVRSICKPCSIEAVMAYRATPAGAATHRRAARKYAKSPDGSAKKVAIARRAAQRDPAKYLLIRARCRAKRLCLPFSLTKDDIVIPERCPVLGVKLVVAERRFRGHGAGGADDSMSLDRIRPSLGYVPGNVAVISWQANRMKGGSSLEELERLVAWMRSLRG